jgi:hypothetical protein
METVAIDSKLAMFLDDPESATDAEMREAVAAMTLASHPLVIATERLVASMGELKDGVEHLVVLAQMRKAGAR